MANSVTGNKSYPIPVPGILHDWTFETPSRQIFDWLHSGHDWCTIPNDVRVKNSLPDVQCLKIMGWDVSQPHLVRSILFFGLLSFVLLMLCIVLIIMVNNIRKKRAAERMHQADESGIEMASMGAGAQGQETGVDNVTVSDPVLPGGYGKMEEVKKPSAIDRINAALARPKQTFSSRHQMYRERL